MEKQAVFSMTEGSPVKLLMKFTIPMLIGNLFQQFYNMVDSIVVGRFVGKTRWRQSVRQAPSTSCFLQ